MKLCEKKMTLATMTENIEMALFSSEELCLVILTPEQEEQQEEQEDQEEQEEQEEQGHNFQMKRLEHPLDPNWKPAPEVQPEVQPWQQANPKSEGPSGEEAEPGSPVPAGCMEEIEIEMEASGEDGCWVLPPFKVFQSVKLLPNKVRRVKWRRLVPQRCGLVVKDVVCLPSDLGLAQLERPIVPQGKERAALVAMGMVARITIDYSWSANQMESRLEMLFTGKFERQRFNFMYLQCLQGSRALFVPDTPADGWTGEQVLRIAGHGPLYVFHQLDEPQAECETSAKEMLVVNRKEFCCEANTESCHDGDNQPGEQMQPLVSRTTDEIPLDLDTVLRLFRQKNMNPDVETHIQVRRRELLCGAEEVVMSPRFSFRTTPIISFSGEEIQDHEEPLREFFRKYYQAGVLIGWSLAQGGPGPRCLHPALYQWMCGLNPSMEDFSSEDIADAEVQQRLQQLQFCTDVKLLSPSLCDWVSSCGIPGIYSASSNQIPAIYMGMVKRCIYNRVASMISQFIEGMNSCGGLWNTVQSHWEAFVPVMTSTPQEPLTLEEFKQLFQVCYSHEGSQLRASEEATVGYWETVLTFISNDQAEFSFEDVLEFITGADHLPPLGFPRSISLHFYSQDGLPHASTSAPELFLPRAVAGAVDLLVLLSRAVHEAPGFTGLQRDG
ncbi:unnamed protein product [Pleuronectes platessa]|uniref:HECT domain-containing protein n=1 Tax=Pleuronectes platessa TaxID=8262 RepID=A0A9N7Z0F8_PLEPL|nr:unnamed protein product [Pleuronectes platessa]